MAHVADELEHDRETAAARDHGGGLESVPDVVADKRLLRLVPWAGDGPDPLLSDEGGA